MPSREEKTRRKALKNATRQNERKQARAGLPLPPEQMRELFDFVDRHTSVSECSGTLQCTRLFLRRKKIAAGPVIQWLEEAGGFCDCEALDNAEERFLFAMDED